MCVFMQEGRIVCKQIFQLKLREENGSLKKKENQKNIWIEKKY